MSFEAQLFQMLFLPMLALSALPTGTIAKGVAITLAGAEEVED